MSGLFLALVVGITTQVADANLAKEYTFEGWLRPEPPSSCATVLGGCVDGVHKYNIPHLTWQICHQYLEKARIEAPKQVSGCI